MRVLHFLPAYVPAWHFGGPILSVSRLCEGLVHQGVDVCVITTNAGLGEFPVDQLGVPQSVNGVTVIYYPVDKNSRVVRSTALVNSLPRHMKWADLLHLSSIWQPLGIPVQCAAHAAGVPVIQTLRGALGPYSWRRSVWKKLPYYLLKERPLLQRAAALHCTTMQEAREISWLGLKAPIQLLPNPMELTQLHYSRELGEVWRYRMGISSEIPLFLVAGRQHHKKGLDLLPTALQGLAHLSWQIVFLGIDEDGTGLKLQKAFERAGLAERCHWLEHVPADQLAGPYNASDCLLLPSRHENFGNVVLEALACGSGVLISDHVGLAETIKTCPGVRIRPRRSDLWTSEIRDILSAIRPGPLAAEWVVKSFSKQLVARQSMDLYASILSHG